MIASWQESMTNLDSMLKSRDITTDKGLYSQGYCLPLGNFPGGSDRKASTHNVGDVG